MNALNTHKNINAISSQASRPWVLSQPSPRILLAEDDLDMRDLLAAALNSDGYDVVKIADGAELLQKIHSCQRYGKGQGFDAIVSDIRMPTCSGLEVLADLRSTNTTVPVILMTAFGDEKTAVEAKRLGAAIFNKPFDVDDLRTALLNIIPPHSGPTGHGSRERLRHRSTRGKNANGSVTSQVKE